MKPFNKLCFGIMLILSAMSDALESTVDEKSMKVVGSATLSILFWDIYTAQLSTASGRYSDGQQDFELSLTYLRAIEKDDLLTATEEQWQHLGISKKKYNDWLIQLSKLWPDVGDNDNITLKVINSNSSFYHNDKLLGTISDPIFGTHFSAIWLSEKSKYPKLRAQLIGHSK